MAGGVFSEAQRQSRAPFTTWSGSPSLVVGSLVLVSTLEISRESPVSLAATSVDDDIPQLVSFLADLLGCSSLWTGLAIFPSTSLSLYLCSGVWLILTRPWTH